MPGATGAAPTWTASAAWSSWAGVSGGRPASVQLPGEVAVDLGGHHRAEDGRAEAAADLHRGLLETAGDAGELQRRVADDDLGGADHDGREAEAEQREPDATCRPLPVSVVQRRHAVHGDGGERPCRPTSGTRGPILVIIAPASGEPTIIMPVSGSRCRPAVDRAHAVHVLQVEGDEEQAAHEGEGHEHHQDRAGGQRHGAEQSERDERFARPWSPRTRTGRSRARRRPGSPGHGVAPAPLRRP